MKVLSLDQDTLKMLGIISSKGKSYYLKMLISQYVCVITPIAFMSPLFAFFLKNFRDVGQATSAFYLICIAGMASITYSDFWLKRATLLSIIRRIQAIVDDTIESYKPSYIKVEHLAHKIVHYFKVCVFISVFGVVSVPMCVLIYLWFAGDYSSAARLLPAALL